MKEKIILHHANSSHKQFPVVPVTVDSKKLHIGTVIDYGTEGIVYQLPATLGGFKKIAVKIPKEIQFCERLEQEAILMHQVLFLAERKEEEGRRNSKTRGERHQSPDSGL
jgi:hypothetical protein